MINLEISGTNLQWGCTVNLRFWDRLYAHLCCLGSHVSSTISLPTQLSLPLSFLKRWRQIKPKQPTTPLPTESSKEPTVSWFFTFNSKSEGALGSVHCPQTGSVWLRCLLHILLPLRFSLQPYMLQGPPGLRILTQNSTLHFPAQGPELLFSI